MNCRSAQMVALRLGVLLLLVLATGSGVAAEVSIPFAGVESPSSGGSADEVRRAAQAIALGLHDMADLPGFALAVGLGDEILLSEAFGQADLETISPVTPLTRFRIGSVSKCLTAAGAVILAESGTLDLDRPIRRYLPDLPEALGGATARQLAGHLGGVRHYEDGRLVTQLHYDDVSDALDLFLDAPLIAPPGTEYEYSTFGYVLLSAVMERAAGRPFVELMDELVFAPVGMRSTGPDDVTRVVPHRAGAYRIEDGGIVSARPTDNSYKWAGGGFLSTPEDLVRFGLALLNGRLVSAGGLEALFRSQQTAEGEDTGYGMGFRPRRDAEGRPVVHHGGSSEGARAFLLLYPEERLVVAMVANRETAPLFEEEAQGVAHFFLDHLRTGGGEVDGELSGRWRFSGSLGDGLVEGDLRLYRRGETRGMLHWSDEQAPIRILLVDRHGKELRLFGAGPHGLMHLALDEGIDAGTGRWQYLGKEGTAELSSEPRLSARRSPRARVLSRLELAVRFTNLPSPPLRLADRMEHYRVPAVSIAVIDDGRIVWTAAEGTKRAGSVEPVTPETIFQVKSVSKPVVAVAALGLVEEGLLALDEPVAERLESWALPDSEHVRSTAPTLRHLLSHRAGFTRGGVDSYRPDQEVPTLLESLAGEPPATSEPLAITFEPGTRFRYSGGGYGVLQQLLVDVTDESFPRLMDRRVFRPLGMTHSFYFEEQLPEPVLPFAAMGHDSDGALLPGGYEILPIQAAGGLWSTPRDLALFVLELQRGWGGRPGGLLEPATVLEMTTPAGDGWGLGVELETHGPTPMFFHTGSGDGFKAIAVGYLGVGKGAVIAANGDGAGELRYEILRAIAREHDWPGFHDVVEYEVADVAADALAPLVGSYRWNSGLLNEVALRDGQLWTRFAYNAWRPLYPLSARRFVTSGNVIYEFRGKGAETLVSIEEGVAYEAARTVPDAESEP